MAVSVYVIVNSEYDLLVETARPPGCNLSPCWSEWVEIGQIQECC